MTIHFKNIAVVFYLFFFHIGYAQTPRELRSWLPDASGWTIQEDIEVFNPDNLFDRINGAAPLFIENNFREMTSLEYKKGDDYITIQAYRHASPQDAFGMYASERSSDLAYLPIGGEAQGDDKILYFFAGNIYVKMWTNSNDDITETIRMIGKSLADRIDSEAAYPPLIQLFPERGKIPHTESYVTSSYIGHDFLKSVYSIKYESSGQAFQLFVVDGATKEGTEEVLKKYYTFTKQPTDYKEGGLLIKDRYNGDIPVVWKGRYIIGVFNENGETIADAGSYVNELAAKL